jgi:predicted phage terminase large subunit-like protein
LLDVFRQRLTFPQLKKAVVENFRKFDVSKVLVEDRSSGISLLQELRLEIYCLEAYGPGAGQDKLMRLAAQSIKFESGRVYLPSDATWLKEFKSEIIGFPGTKHDDQVDSTSQALEYLGRMVPYGEGRVAGAFSWGRETC